MTSEAKVLANRQNALKSTGPRDTSLTRFNALKHGLTAEKMVVAPFEDPNEYKVLVEALRNDFQPQTSIEELLIQQMASSLWRRQRIIRGERVQIESGLASSSLKFDSLERIETNYLMRVIAGEERNLDLREKATANRWRRWREKQSPQEQARLAATAQNPPSVDILRLVNAREDFKKLGETVEKRKQLHLESQLSINPDALKIRYDSSLERQFYRAMVMLLKIKEARAKDNGFVSQETKLAQTIPDPDTGMMDDHAEGDDKENYDVTEDLPIMEVFRKIIRSGVMAEEGREKFARHIMSLPEPRKSQAIEELKKQGLVKVLEEIKKTEDEKAVKTTESPDNIPIRITGTPQSEQRRKDRINHSEV